MSASTDPIAVPDDMTPPEPGAAGKAAQPVTGREVGGRAGPDPTRFGDWEKNGRCIDF